LLFFLCVLCDNLLQLVWPRSEPGFSGANPRRRLKSDDAAGCAIEGGEIALHELLVSRSRLCQLALE
jgi:hypothetical protein